MISNAQLAQLATKFVKDTLQYRKNKKYLVNLCEETLYESYFNYLLSNSDCLDYTTECGLAQIADSLDFTNDEVMIPCEQQLTISVVHDTHTCNNSLSLKNLSNGSPYPWFYPVNNATYIDSMINLVNSSLCDPSTTVINGGCDSVSCSNSLKASVSYVTTDYTITLPTNGYITVMQVYETDSNGNFINLPITLDLNPATSPYYSGTGLTTLILSDVVFSNSNWANNMQTLMNNVSIFRYGITGKHKLTFVKMFNGATFVRVGVVNNILHKPISNLFGINKQSGYFQVYEPSTGKSSVLSDTSSIAMTSSYFYYNTPISTECGSLTPNLNMSSRPKVSGSSNFYNLVLNTNFGETPLALTGTLTSSCSSNTITAVYDPTNVVSVAWQNPALTVISTTDTADLGSLGIYTFTATLSNGCEVVKYYVYT